VNGSSARWVRGLVVMAVLAGTGCASTPAPPASGEIAPIRLRNAQTGINERCGIDMIREVQRANDLGWSERLFFTGSARAAARRAVQDEERWRQGCVDRFKQRGFEVVSTPPAR
jgi:hypothetical protein